MTPSRVVPWLVPALLTVGACSSLTDASNKVLRATVILAGGSSEASRVPPGPFVSVMDSVDVRVTSSGGALLFSTGRRLQRYDTSATLPVEVPAGAAVFSAQILSSNGSTLFSGSTTQNVASDGFAVVVQLTENRPVLVVLPDTAKTTDASRTTFTVYNGGTDSLVWGLLSADAPFNNCGRLCQFFPLSGTIGPKRQMLITAQLFVPAPSGVFSFVLRSPEGDVRVWWQYTVSQTGRVPGANLPRLDQQVRVP